LYMYFYTKNVAFGEPWLSQYYSYTRTSASQEILPRDKTNRKRNKEQKTRSILTPDRTGDINPSLFISLPSLLVGLFVSVHENIMQKYGVIGVSKRSGFMYLRWSYWWSKF
jgi:hypothetical protein